MKTVIPFKDRSEAGALLAKAVQQQGFGPDSVVLGLPRGGIPVAAKVAAQCGAPLDLFVVRKIGTPGHEELAAGAIASGGVLVWNERVLRAVGLTPGDLHETIEAEERQVKIREQEIRSRLTPALVLRDKRVVLVDDGIATGATMRAAIRAIKQLSPKELVVALPVCPDDTCADIERREKCRIICLRRVNADAFGSVGSWYDDFSQVETDECRAILEKSRSGLDQALAATLLTTVPAASHAPNRHQP
jgi:putative phosphoribosyl transferase